MTTKYIGPPMDADGRRFRTKILSAFIDVYRRPILFLFLLSTSAFSQSALHIDLSGEWRMMRGDDPSYAQPNLDDSGWSTAQLPWTTHPAYGFYWLRRSAALPEWADRSQLALTLGTVSEVYEVYVNGARIGATGEFSIEAKQIARPRSFPIPREAAGAGNRIMIAIRVWNFRGLGSNTWEIFADGPYLLTYTSGIDPHWGEASINKRSVRQAPDLITSAAQLTLALMLLIVWLGERRRYELLSLGLYLVVEVASSSTLSFLVAEDTFPWSWWAITGTLILLRVGIFTDLCLRSLAVDFRWLKIILWLFVLSLLGLRRIDGWFSFVFLFLEIFTLGIIAFGWWRMIRDREQVDRHLLAGLLLCVLIAQTNRRGLILFSTNRIILGRYAWSIHEVLVWALAFSITLLLLRRLVADRREKLRLTGELEAARVIQQLLLKQPTMWEPDLSIAAVYHPAQEVGGDFYYVLDERVVVIGDVSGKGLKAAMLVSLLVGVLRGIQFCRPADVLSALNRATAGQIENGFVTCCCARFDASGIVTIANAGHLSPYLDGAEVEIETGLPLGLDAETLYAETTISLPPGGSLTFLSDGVVEAADAKGDLFGFERTRAISLKSAAEIARAAQTFGQNDDITVVTVQRVA